MDIVFEHGELTASEIQKSLPDPPSNSAVRSMIRGLVNKQVLNNRQDGFKYYYSPAVAKDEAKKSALKDVLKTFFGGSAQTAFVELLDMSKSDMKTDDWDRLSEMISDAKDEEK